MAIKQYLDQEGLQLLWQKICLQDQDLNNKIIINSNKINEILEQIGSVKVLYDTTANWNAQPNLISEQGVIYIYSDAKTYDGQALPRIKIGNGVSYLRTIYFIDQDIVHQLENLVPITEQDIINWNDKVTCYRDHETLIFTKENLI